LTVRKHQSLIRFLVTNYRTKTSNTKKINDSVISSHLIL